jgi:hypothetical protein
MGDAARKEEAGYSTGILSENLQARNNTGNLLSMQGQQ